MRFKTSASLMIAIVLGSITAYVGYDVLKKARQGAGTATKIVVAARDMEPGYVIETSDLKLEEIPATLAPAKAFKDAKLVAGRTVLASVVRGYPLIDNQLAAPGSGAGMQAMVPPGMRAVSVAVSDGGAVAGLITPGCYVDVIATFNNGSQQVATTVVQNVKVQFVSRNRPPRSSGNNNAGGGSAPSLGAGSPDQLGAVKTVTLLVTPKQAIAIELANNQGKPRLILRGGADDTDVADVTVRQNELLGIADPPPPATQPAVAIAPPPAPPVAEEAAAEEEPVTDAFEDAVPPPPPANMRRVEEIRGDSATVTYFDEAGARAPGGGLAAAAPPVTAVPANRRPRPTTRPQSLQRRQPQRRQPQQQQQQPPLPAADQPQQQQPRNGYDDDYDAGAGRPQTASGSEPAPRTEPGRKDLRKGM